MDRERVLIVDIGDPVQFDTARLQTGAQLSNNGCTVRRVTGAATSYGVSRVLRARDAGKLYARFRIDQSSSGGVLMGLARPELPSNAGLNIGSDANGWSYNTDGLIWHAGVSTSVGVNASAGDFVDLAVDLTSGKLWFGRNGVWFSGGNPESGTSPLFTNVIGTTFLAVSAFLLGAGVTLIVDDAEIRATCPDGFTPYGILARVANRGFATGPIDVPASVYYEGGIAADGDPIYERRVTCVVWDKGERKGAPLGDMELINIEGTFNYLLGYDTQNAPVRARRGYVGDPVSAFAECAAARVKRIHFLSEGRARVVFADPGAELDKPIPRALFGPGTPNSALVNTPMPLSLGIIRWAPVTNVDPANLEYAFADAAPFCGVIEVRDQGVLLTPHLGFSVAARVDTYGMRRLTNPAGRQCASIRGTGKVVADVIVEEFAAWSSDDPTGWTLVNGPETAAVKVTQSGAAARFLSDGSKAIGIQRGALNAGKFYAFEIVISARSSGKIKLGQTGFSDVARLNKTGTHRGAFIASADATIVLTTDIEATDITVDRFVLQEVRRIERLPDWMTELCITRGGMAPQSVDIAGSISILDGLAPAPLALFSDKALRLEDALKQTLDSFCGWYWFDRFGVLRVGRLSSPGKEAAAITITDMELFGDIDIEPDEAPGLSDTIAALRNYSPHEESELAGSVLASAEVGLLRAEYLINAKTTKRFAAPYANAVGRTPIKTLLTTMSPAQSLADYLATYYAVPRNVYTFSAFVEDDQMAATEPSQFLFLQSNLKGRYGGLQAGKYLQIIGAKSRWLSNLVEFVAVG